jgi:hypothetical protein
VRGMCEECHRIGEVVLTIYAKSGRRVLRCPEHLNSEEDFKANAYVEDESLEQ